MQIIKASTYIDAVSSIGQTKPKLFRRIDVKAYFGRDHKNTLVVILTQPHRLIKMLVLINNYLILNNILNA